MKLVYLLLTVFLFFNISAFNIAPGNKPPDAQSQSPNQPQTKTQIQKSDTIKAQIDTANNNNNSNSGNLGIDTALKTPKQEIITTIDTVKKIDSLLTAPDSENVMTNTKLFLYISLTLLGAGLFFFIFVINLFKTFHKKKSTRQSLLLSWNLFFIVSILWIFIIWGLLAGFWTSATFMTIVIFLFIISLLMTIIAVKSK
ncbi:MAG: hypothetical protein LH629_09080 [Ignavibacteria bacterium]|nr:hypothetical protein [Ignavibacteria bacterium]